MKQTSDWVAAVQAAYLAGRSIVLVFDYDGTLTPLVSHPTLAVLSESVREHLRHLASVERVSVGIISGRALADVRQMVGLDGLFYAGSSGAELDLWGTQTEAPFTAESRRLIEAAIAELETVLPSFPGVWIEQKPQGFTVHYRGATETTASIFHDCFRWLMRRFRGLRSLWVCDAYEVGLVDAWDKGTAVRFILEKLTPSVFPVYFGDSENDRAGMVAVQAARGVTVAVGAASPNCAAFRLHSADEFHRDLGRLREMLACSTN